MNRIATYEGYGLAGYHRRKRHHKHHAAKKHCAGLKRNGRLKKGYRFRRGGGKCPVKAKGR